MGNGIQSDDTSAVYSGYDSPIFLGVQLGDIHSVLRLCWRGLASVYNVDPYSLGLFYVCITLAENFSRAPTNLLIVCELLLLEVPRRKEGYCDV